MGEFSRPLYSMLKDYLHGDQFRRSVERAGDAAAVAVHGELLPFTRTGDLEASTSVDAREFGEGWGLTVRSLYRSYFVANRRGVTRNRNDSVRHAGHPSVPGEAIFAVTKAIDTYDANG